MVHQSQSPFGFWGDWNWKKISKKWDNTLASHNRLSAFGVIGTITSSIVLNCLKAVTIAFRLLGWLEPCYERAKQMMQNAVTIAFRLLGWLELNRCLIHCWNSTSHNRLSAFGVIGTNLTMGNLSQCLAVTIAFRLLGWLEQYQRWRCGGKP